MLLHQQLHALEQTRFSRLSSLSRVLSCTLLTALELILRVGAWVWLKGFVPSSAKLSAVTFCFEKVSP